MDLTELTEQQGELLTEFKRVRNSIPRNWFDSWFLEYIGNISDAVGIIELALKGENSKKWIEVGISRFEKTASIIETNLRGMGAILNAAYNFVNHIKEEMENGDNGNY